MQMIFNDAYNILQKSGVILVNLLLNISGSLTKKGDYNHLKVC